MKAFVRIALAAVLFSSCTKQNKNFEFIGDIDGIFSTRPQTSTHSLMVIKLQNPPLLGALTNEGKVDADLLKAVQEEQDGIMQELLKISPEIKAVFRYRMVMNGMAVVVPAAVVDQVRKLTNVVYLEDSGSFARPIQASLPLSDEIKNTLSERNSTKFIGADLAHARQVRGQGMKVGIIDTGIDYTHAMFGGAGTEEAFKAIDPSKEATGYPNAKVVGGIDLVGTKYDSASADFKNRVPRPDANPLDEGGHGTHVAGTVAGLGDGVNTIDGIAPDASLYAIKVFGAEGSTGDAVVIAALEYSADPNVDADVADRLDVVNLSLGSPYGEGHTLYTEAVQNLTIGGTVVVAAAGNSGDSQYKVGAPSVADNAFSIAASVDDMDQNWKFNSIRFSTTEKPELFVEAIESTMTKPISDLKASVSAALVDIGLADTDLTDDQKAALTGKVAFIERGKVTFAEKIKRAAEGGAIGVVVANNQDGDAFAMGGDGKFEIPAVMVTKELGAQLKASIAKGVASVEFFPGHKIEKAELIDTMAGFSSKGPRSLDSLIKPEIAAPGSLVVSAEMGGGKKGVAMSGTSMATPQMAGVMALLKQTHPTLNVLELKALAMGTAKTMVDAAKKTYPVSRQGAGRVQVIPALEAKALALPSAVSLGELSIEKKKAMSRKIAIKNLSSEALNLSVSFEGSSALALKSQSSISIEAGKAAELPVRFTVDASNLQTGSTELDGLLLLKDGDKEVLRLPVLAVVNKISQIAVESLVVRSTSEADAQGADVDVTLANNGVSAGDAYLFNLIGLDGKKASGGLGDVRRSNACDLAGAGYRVIKKEGKSVLQVAAKLHEPVSTWDMCEISVLIDSNGDKVADQELLGIKADHLPGVPNDVFVTMLLDAKMARDIRKKFEEEKQAGKPDLEETYVDAIMDAGQMLAFEHSTVAIIEVPVASLGVKPTGELSVQIATSYGEMSSIEPDDFLGEQAWFDLNVSDLGAAFVKMPEKITVEPGAKVAASLEKGAGSEKLFVLYPNNKTVVGGLEADRQSEITAPVYKVD